MISEEIWVAKRIDDEVAKTQTFYLAIQGEGKVQKWVGPLDHSAPMKMEMEYQIDGEQCSCPAHKFNGTCKHLGMYHDKPSGDGVPMTLVMKAVARMQGQLQGDSNYASHVAGIDRNDQDQAVLLRMTTTNPDYRGRKHVGPVLCQSGDEEPKKLIVQIEGVEG